MPELFISGKNITVGDFSATADGDIPYIYVTAHNASKTGIPIMRPPCPIFPEGKSMTDVTNMYIFGENFLVAAFDMNICLPNGKWRDIFTGKIYEGGKNHTYEIPKRYGGGFFS